jgi:uncharacterized Tic20 family protein
MTNANNDVLNPRQRQINVDAILNSIHSDQQDFNVMLLAFTDIIQASFYSFMKGEAASEAVLRRKEEQVDAMITTFLESFNKSDLDNVQAILVLVTCMIESINRALDHQQQNGIPIQPEIKVSAPLSRSEVSKGGINQRPSGQRPSAPPPQPKKRQ